MGNTAERYDQAYFQGLRPDPLLLVSQWADRHRVLASVASSEPGFWRTTRTPYLREVMDCMSPSSPVERIVLMKGAQLGGPLALDTPIPTVVGWKTMGALQVGDTLFDEQGHPCQVTWVSETMTERQCFDIKFDDGAHIVCDGAHRWPVWDFTDAPIAKVLRTEEMVWRVRIGNSERYRYAIDCCMPVDLEEQDLIIHPYVLGIWLGDGSSFMNHISVHEDDEEIAEHLRDCGVEAVFRLPKWRKGKCANIVIDPTFRIANDDDRHVDIIQHRSLFTKRLGMLDLIDNKHVPAQYLRASHAQRLELLRGFMDSDGSITLDGKRCEFCNTNLVLVNAVAELLRSLGYKPQIYHTPSRRQVFAASDRECQALQFWRVSWTGYREEPMFRLSRKIERMRSIEIGRPSRSKKRRIVAILPVESVAVRCISVDSPSHLYLCGKAWIPTHNTEVGLNWLGYIIHQSPGPILMVQPTVEMAKTYSKQRLDPLIEASPVLRDLVREPRSRDSGNSIFLKEFYGGILRITGANSAAGLSSMPVRFLFLDEVDRYPGDVDGEGDPVALAIQRTVTFANRKVLIVSTPTIKGFSRIEAAYEESDQRRYWVPCPFCKQAQVLEWQQVQWPDGEREKAYYICIHCGEIIREHHKGWMLEHGQWIAGASGDGNTVGFHLSSLYSPLGWVSWGQIAVEHGQVYRDPPRFKAWRNTKLGLSWEESAEQLDGDDLMERREMFGPLLPPSVVILTAGVDVQDDRLEVEIVGWGRDEESWSIGYWVLWGDPASPAVWQDLENLLYRAFPHSRQVSDHYVRAAAVDTGGHRSMEAYTFCRTRQERRIWAIKGFGGMGKPIWPRRSSRNNKGRVPHFMVGVDAAKESIYSRLRLKEPGPGYCHFPLDRDAEWFRQLTAEKITTRYNKGRPIREWVKKSHDRNEALDCRVYAMAALHGLISMGFQLSKEADQREQYPLKEGQPPPEPVAHVAVQIIVPKKLKIIMPDKPRKSSWLGPLRDRWINGGR